MSYQVDALEETGYLSRRPGCPRSIVVTERYEPGAPAKAAGERVDDSARIPLVGRIAAGGPVLALEDIEDELLPPRSLVGHGDLIALQSPATAPSLSAGSRPSSVAVSGSSAQVA